MLLVLLNTFSTQYNEFDFSAIYRADSAGSRILSFVFHNFIMSVYVFVCVDANYRKVNQLHVCTCVYFINPATVKA